jgi:hypothetical protein
MPFLGRSEGYFRQLKPTERSISRRSRAMLGGREAEITKEQRTGVIKNLLNEANKQTESHVEAPRVSEVVPAK